MWQNASWFPQPPGDLIHADITWEIFILTAPFTQEPQPIYKQMPLKYGVRTNVAWGTDGMKEQNAME